MIQQILKNFAQCILAILMVWTAEVSEIMFFFFKNGEIHGKGHTDVTWFSNILHLAFLINFQLCSLHLNQKPVQL